MERRSFLGMLAVVPLFALQRWQTLTGTWTVDHSCELGFDSIAHKITVAACSDGKLRAWFGNNPMSVVKPRRWRNSCGYVTFAGESNGWLGETQVKLSDDSWLIAYVTMYSASPDLTRAGNFRDSEHWDRDRPYELASPPEVHKTWLVPGFTPEITFMR